MPDYRYTLGSPTWDTSDGNSHWRAPDGAVGMLDFRGLPACGEAGTSTNRQVALCWFPPTAVVPADHTVLNAVPGDCREINVTPGMRTAFMSRVGVMPSDINGKLSGLILDLFTNKSNPEATDAVPTLESETIYMTGHSPVISLPSEWRTLQGYRQYSDRYTLKQQLKVRQWMNEEDAGTMPLGVSRKALGYLLIQHKILGRAQGNDRVWDESDWQTFVHPSDRNRMRERGGPRKPETMYTDNFDGTDQNPISSPWGSMRGTWARQSNRLRRPTASSGSGVYDFVRYNSDLSSSNHYCQFQYWSDTSSSKLLMPSARKDSSGTFTYYAAQMTPTGFRGIVKIVSDTITTLTYDTTSYSLPKTVRITVDGSSLTLTVDGMSDLTTTDTAITGGLRVGAATGPTTSSDPVVDNFEAADLAAAVSIPVIMAHRQTQGMS